MSTYLTFLKTPDPLNEYDQTGVTVTSTSDVLPDVLEAFEGFLHAAGFVFTGASLRLVDDTTQEPRRYDSDREDGDWVARMLRELRTEMGEPTPPRPGDDEKEVGS